MTDHSTARALVEKLPSKELFCHGTIPEPLTAEERQWLVDQLHAYPKRVDEARTCAIGALTEMATTEFCRLMAEQTLTPPEGDTVSDEVVATKLSDEQIDAIYDRIDKLGAKYSRTAIRVIGNAAIAALQSRVSPQAANSVLGESDVYDRCDEDAGGGGLQGDADQHSRPVGRSRSGEGCDARSIAATGRRARQAVEPGDAPVSEHSEHQLAVSPQEGLREALEKCLAIACDYTLDERTARSDIANIARAALSSPPAEGEK